MKIFVKVKPGAKKELVKKISENIFEISVKERPEKGLANRAVEEALAEYFGVAKNRARIISGHTSRKKILEIYFDKNW